MDRRSRRCSRQASSTPRPPCARNRRTPKDTFHSHVPPDAGRIGRRHRERIRFSRTIRESALAALKINGAHPGAMHVLGMWNAEIMRVSGLSRTSRARFWGRTLQSGELGRSAAAAGIGGAPRAAPHHPPARPRRDLCGSRRQGTRAGTVSWIHSGPGREYQRRHIQAAGRRTAETTRRRSEPCNPVIPSAANQSRSRPPRNGRRGRSCGNRRACERGRCRRATSTSGCRAQRWSREQQRPEMVRAAGRVPQRQREDKRAQPADREHRTEDARQHGVNGRPMRMLAAHQVKCRCHGDARRCSPASCTCECT